MAYGLKIKNPSGHVTVDSDYKGIYYLGKGDVSGSGVFSVPGYADSTTEPLIFIRPHTFNSGKTTIERISKDSGSAPGSIDGSTLTINGTSVGSQGSNYYYCYSDQISGSQSSNNAPQYSSQSSCEAVGGTWFSGNSGSPLACRRTTDLIIAADSKERTTNDHYPNGTANNNYASIKMTFNSSGQPTGHSVESPGYGWDTSGTDSNVTMGNNAWFLNAGAGIHPVIQGNSGFYLFDSSAGRFYPEHMPVLTATSLLTGWNVTLNSDITNTVYAFGLGGTQLDSSDFGLELMDSSGNVTFTTNRPPPLLRGIETVSMTTQLSPNGSLSYYSTNDDGEFTGGSTTFSGTYPEGYTAYNALPVFPTCCGGAYFDFEVFGSTNIGFQLFSKKCVSHLRANSSGGNFTGLTHVSFISSNTDSLGSSGGAYPNHGAAGSAGTSAASGTNITAAVPTWDQVSTTHTTNTGSTSTVRNNSYSVQNMIPFLNTTLFDSLSY